MKIRSAAIQSALLAMAVAFASVVGACSNGNKASGSGGSSGKGSGGSYGSGGTAGSGGVTSSGGTVVTGGQSGSENSGGVAGNSSGGAAGNSSGGAAGNSSGGAAGNGGSGGRTTGLGGTSSSGGVVGTGGATSTTTSGGGQGTGGAVGTGGSVARGGSSGSGGAVGTGGNSGSGGSTGTGGATGAGGSTVCAPPSGSPTATPIQLNDNGGWNWHMDERAMVDTKGNKLIVGSVASGGSRNGYVEAVTYDLAAKTKKLNTLGTGLASNVDDHNSASFLVRPDGKYVALWSSHRTDCYTRFNIFDGSAWTGEKKFDWAPLGCPWAGASTNMVTYANPWYLGSTIFAAFRSVDSSPAFLTSTDNGQSYSYYGRLTKSKQIGYVAGYYKYWGNNTDRIDFCGTEAHPRDYDTNLWHGYVQDDKVYNSTGTVIASPLKDTNSTTTNAKDISAFTQVFKTGSSVGGVAIEHAWNLDMVRYDDGTVVILGQGRAVGTCGTTEGYGKTNCDPDKRILYFRFDGTSWKGTYLVKAGPKLYSTEEDYIGAGALHPNDPHTIFISSTYDPRDDKAQTTKREIYQGTTCDNGATWQWTPITRNSTVDNIRPIVPKWDAKHTALVWMKGTYSTAQSYSMQIVGLISEHAEGQVSFQ